MNSTFIYRLVFLGSLLLLGYNKSFCQNSDQKMQQLLEEKRVYNRSLTEKEGFKIQLYNGLSQTQANQIQQTFLKHFPNIPARLSYEQPEWKIQVGNYLTELEAYKMLVKVREKFEGALICRAKVRLNEK